MDEWISVSDRLPDTMLSVIVLVDIGGYRRITYGYHDGVTDYWGFIDYPNYKLVKISDHIDIDCTVTHWQPLPEPPEGE